MNFPKLISDFKFSIAACFFLIALNVALAKSVSENFSAAQKAFSKSNYEQAQKILRDIIDKYPEYKAAYFLLGRVYYHQGKLPKAAKAFRESGYTSVRGAAAFEYGIAFFAVNDCRHALKGFGKVAVESDQADLAAFYAGVCYIRSRQWYQAERLLKRAKHLPANLAVTRRDLLVQLRKKRQEERAGTGRQTMPYSVVPMPAPYYAPPSVYGPPISGEDKGVGVWRDKDGPQQPQKVAEPPKLSYGFSNTLTPKAEYKSAAERVEFHEFSTKDSTTQSLGGGLDLQWRYDTKADSENKQSTAKLGSNVFYRNITNYGKKVALTRDPDDPTIISGKENVKPPKNSKVGEVTLFGGYTFPVSKEISLEGRYDIFNKYPDMATKDSTSKRGPKFNVSIAFDPVTLSGSAAQFDRLDGKGQRQTTDQILSSDANIDISNFDITGSIKQEVTSHPQVLSLGGFQDVLTYGVDLSKNFEALGFSLGYAEIARNYPADYEIQYFEENIPVGLDERRVDLGASISLDMGISISAALELAQIDRIFIGIPESKIKLADPGSETIIPSTANADETTFKSTFKYIIIEWAAFVATFRQSEWVYQVPNPEHLRAYRESIVSFQQVSEFALTFNKAF